MTSKKIADMDWLAKVSKEKRVKGERVVLCHGTFDLLHAGHIRYLQRAKREGEILIVTLTADRFVNKGPGRPVFPEELRAENLAALECVDYVAIDYSPTAVGVLEKIQPTLYVKGAEYRDHARDITGNIVLEQKAVERFGGRIFFTDEITFSSSSLLNEYFGVFTRETKEFLQEFRSKFSFETVNDSIDSLAALKVLVIGDAIVDQYHYVNTLGQTGKGNVLAVRYKSEEQFAGGALAVANHISQFVDSVSIVTGLGGYDSHEDFIRSKLQPNVIPFFSYFLDAPTVTKRRFVDDDLAKLFEVYYCADEPLLADEDLGVLKWMQDNVSKYDLVVSADFGNGFITNKMVDVICNHSNFLAVNTQVNSGNRGFHVINRYPRADFVSLNEPELRLASHNRSDPIEEVCVSSARKLSAKFFAVTRGTKGVNLYTEKYSRFFSIPALSSRIVDRIGAGDAYLSLASICFARGINPEIANFIGSVAAALDVQIVCNREPIKVSSLKKFISTLLK